MIPQFVTKRDGTKQPYDQSKIAAAANKAINEVPAYDEQPPVGFETWGQYIAQDVECNLEGEPTIEQIQDLVEASLMENGLIAAAKAFILYRDERAKKRALKAPEGAVTDYIHASKYARHLKDQQRRELHHETVTRVMEMHIRRFPTLEEPIRRHFKQVYEKRVMPSMRSMQFGGKAIEDHNARIYNCSFTHIDRPEVFGHAFYLLLCGCGVGYSVQKQHVAKLPAMGILDRKQVEHHTVEDTIEGWGDAVNALIQAHIHGWWIEFNYSKIRPEGKPLISSGGKAPGHIPLKRALIEIGKVLSGAAGRQLKPIECHDIMCYIAEAVLAGGIRRSSLISLFSNDDDEMMRAKTPTEFSWGGKNAQREMANNSAVWLRSEFNDNPETKLSFRNAFDFAVKNYGEPGFFLTDNLDYGTNPCSEIGLNPIWSTKATSEEDIALLESQGLVQTSPGILTATGFAFCNLCEINMAKVTNAAEAEDAAIAASFIGTLQASYTSFPYLGETTELIAKREALLGVGLTGMMDNPRMSFDPDNVRAMAELVNQANLVTAAKIGIKPACRTTCVKPSGTASLALGMIGSGIHPHHAQRYFRRITANRLEPVAQYFKSINPHMVTEKPNGDWCLTFPVEAPEGVKTVKEMSAVEFLGCVFMTYENWITTGTVCDKHSPGLTHNVSSTVVVGPDEWDTVFEMVWANRDKVQGMAFLPRSGDKGNPFMPREEVLAEDEGRWADLISKYKPVDYAAMVEVEDGTAIVMDPACSAGVCSIG